MQEFWDPETWPVAMWLEGERADLENGLIEVFTMNHPE